MNFSLLLSALRARPRLFFMILAGTVLVTLVVSLVMPKTYVAKASLFLEGKDDQTMRNVNPIQFERDRSGFLQTQVDILTSPRVARRVVGELRLADDAEARADFENAGGSGSIEDWLAEAMIKKLKVDITSSSVLQLSYSADNSKFATRAANGFAKAYLDTMLDLRVEPTRETSKWFDEQLKGLRQNVEQAERRLSEFQQESGILANDEHTDMSNVRLNGLASELVRMPDAGLLNYDGITPKETLPEIQGSGSIQLLKADLLRAEVRLQELSTQLGSQHPEYLRQLALVQGMRNTVEAEMTKAISTARQSAQRSQQYKQRLESELASQRSRVLKMREARNRLAVLTHDVELAQRTYDTAVDRFMASTIEGRARQTNVSILSKAVTPMLPTRPRLMLNFVISVVIGGLLGFVTVYLLELSDRRIRTLEDIVIDPETPLLAVLSAWDPGKDRLLGSPTALPALPQPA